MSAVDRHGAAVDLLCSAVTADTDGDVSDVDVEGVRYALSLAQLAGLDVARLLDSQGWAYRPDLLLRVACPDDAIYERECRLHAVWCARQVQHLWPAEHRTTFRRALLTAWRFALGRAAQGELDAAWAAWAARAAGAAAWDAGAGATWAAAGDAGAAAWAARAAGAAASATRAAQQRRLVQRAVQLLDAGGEE